MNEKRLKTLMNRYDCTEFCTYCHVKFHSLIGDRKPTKDHVISSSKGGKNNRENIKIVCSLCNKSKAALSLSEWKEEIIKCIEKHGTYKNYTKRRLGHLLEYLNGEYPQKESKKMEVQVAKVRISPKFDIMPAAIPNPFPYGDTNFHYD